MDMTNKSQIKKPVKLRTIFIEYISVFCISMFLTALIVGISFVVLMALGVILPADYSLKQLAAVKATIASSETVTPNLIPELCKYAVYTEDGKIIAGNLETEEAKDAWKLLSKSTENQDYAHFYLKIPRKNEVCIVRYEISAKFHSVVLRRLFPSPESVWIGLFIIGILIEVFILASSFGKMLTQKMSILQNAVEKIQSQDLDFSMESSGILEIDNAFFSMEKLKEALKLSLKKQWDLEQTRREQMSALAHDIKTPLTIVRGNAELLAETNQDAEQKGYVDYIMQSAGQMEQYIKALIDISKAEDSYILNKENVDSKKFIDEIHSHINALTSVNKLELSFVVHNLPRILYADSVLLKRAIMNIVSNAVEYSPEYGKLYFTVEAVENGIRFCVTDCGKGFSQEDLKQATKQFYMGDYSRNSKIHYGMGLYIAESIAKLHDGTIQISNSTTTGGGQVVLELPIC